MSPSTIASRLDLRDQGCELDDAVGIDLALERTAEGDAQRHGAAEAVASRTGGDASSSGEGLLDGSALVALVERLGDAEREPDLVEARRDETLVALLVEREPGADRVVTGTGRGDDLLRAGHLRYATRVDEARDLDRGQAGLEESPDELCSDLDVEDLRLVLQPVARTDVVHGDAPGLHAARHPTQVTTCYKLWRPSALPFM